MTTNARLALLLAALLLGACHKDEDDVSTSSAADASGSTSVPDSDMQAPPPVMATAAGAMASTDTGLPAPTAADAVPLIAAIDQHEIDAAGLAKDKATRQDVKDYAAMLAKDHGDNLAEAKALPGASTDADSPAVAAMKSKADASMAALRAADPAGFDQAWLQAMIDGHGDALALLDNQLIPGATDPAVKAFLDKTRGAVSNHLEQAKTLQTGAQ